MVVVYLFPVVEEVEEEVAEGPDQEPAGPGGEGTRAVILHLPIYR